MRCTKIRCPIQHGQVKEPCTQTDCTYRTEPFSNGDHVRLMMDYELADFLIDWEDDPKASGHDGFTSVLRWLQQPYEEETQ